MILDVVMIEVLQRVNCMKLQDRINRKYKMGQVATNKVDMSNILPTDPRYKEKKWLLEYLIRATHLENLAIARGTHSGHVFHAHSHWSSEPGAVLNSFTTVPREEKTIEDFVQNQRYQVLLYFVKMRMREIAEITLTNHQKFIYNLREKGYAMHEIASIYMKKFPGRFSNSYSGYSAINHCLNGIRQNNRNGIYHGGIKVKLLKKLERDSFIHQLLLKASSFPNTFEGNLDFVSLYDDFIATHKQHIIQLRDDDVTRDWTSVIERLVDRYRKQQKQIKDTNIRMP